MAGQAVAAANGNAADYFVDRHIRAGDGARMAFIDPGRSLTYAELNTATRRFAGALEALRIGREQRVAMVMLDTIDFPIAFWGAIRVGIVPVPVNTLLPPDQLGYILTDSRAQALFVSAPLLPALLPVLSALPDLGVVVVANPDGTTPELGLSSHVRFADFLAGGEPGFDPVFSSRDEVAFWLYSSGSTGVPKGVKHVHGSLRATADTYGAEVLGIRPGDVMFSASKLFHAYGLGNGMTFPMSVGAHAVLWPDRATPDAVLGTIRRHRPTMFAAVPTLYAALLAHPAIGPKAGSDRLRRCISAGEALPAPVGLRWSEVVGVDILDGIGSTEMLHIFVSSREDRVCYGTSGIPVPGYDVRIVDEGGRDVADGENGELLVRGPSAAEGYWNQREKSRRTFEGTWTRTGDTYTREPNGSYRFCGRVDEMFKVSGTWVSPFEVEAALMSHPSVLEAAVVAHEDKDGFTKPRGFVVLKSSASRIEPAALHALLKEHVKAQVASWKCPRWIEVVDALPKTATGKIQRFKLREMA